MSSEYSIFGPTNTRSAAAADYSFCINSSYIIHIFITYFVMKRKKANFRDPFYGKPVISFFTAAAADGWLAGSSYCASSTQEIFQHQQEKPAAGGKKDLGGYGHISRKVE